MSIRQSALKALAQALLSETSLPNVHVLVGEPVGTGELELPCMVIQTEGPWMYEPSDEDPVTGAADPDRQLLASVGEITGSISLLLTATTAAGRAALEEEVLHFFLGRHEGSPGLAFLTTEPVTVGSALTLYEAPVGVELERFQWDDVPAFDRRRRSRIFASVHMPALILRQDVPTIETLVLAITNDLASDTPQESVSISEDGDLTLY